MTQNNVKDDDDSASVQTESLTDILVQSRAVKSRSEARRIIMEGGVSFNGTKIDDINFEFANDDSGIIKIGKKKCIQITRIDK